MRALPLLLLLSCGESGPLPTPDSVPTLEDRCESYAQVSCMRGDLCDENGAGVNCIEASISFCCTGFPSASCEGVPDQEPTLTEWRECTSYLNSISDTCDDAVAICSHCKESIPGLADYCD